MTLGPAERRLLLGALDVRAAPLERVDGELDWDAVLSVAGRAKILPALAHHVLRAAHAPVPEPVRARLAQAREETALYNTCLLADLARAVRALHDAGVEHVLLKGGALMLAHYPSPALRHAVDIDLLIDPARFDAGRAALHRAGFVVAPFAEQLGFDGRSVAEALDAPHWHTCAPLQGPSGANVDLHRRVPVSAFERDGGFASMRRRAQTVALHGTEVSVCAPIDLAAHLCEHFALHHHADPEDAPRLLCDLRVMFGDTPPWDALRTASVRRKLAVALAARLFAAAFAPRGTADPLTSLLQRVAVADPAVAPVLAELSALQSYGERFAQDLRYRPGYALRKILPARSYMAARYGVDARSSRLPGLYVRRLFESFLEPLRRGRSTR